jgi:predicted porin
MLFQGGVYNGRRPQITGKFGALEIALVEPVTAGILGYDNQDTDVTIPNLQASYKFKVAGLSIDIGGGYQTYDVVDSNDDDESIDSYIVAIGGSYSMGPFYFAANYWMGTNVGNMGMVNDGFDDAAWDPVDEDLLDNDGWGFIVCAAFTMSDMLRFEAGYAMNEFDVDEADEEDDTSTYYVQATINLAKGVFIVPEVGVVDYGNDSFDNDEGDLTYYGLKWQINF